MIIKSRYFLKGYIALKAYSWRSILVVILNTLYCLHLFVELCIYRWDLQWRKFVYLYDRKSPSADIRVEKWNYSLAVSAFFFKLVGYRKQLVASESSSVLMRFKYRNSDPSVTLMNTYTYILACKIKFDFYSLQSSIYANKTEFMISFFNGCFEQYFLPIWRAQFNMRQWK